MHPLLKLNFFVRKLHRWCVLLVALLGLIMLTTGLCMRFFEITRALLPMINLGTVQLIHYTVSPFFALILFIQIVTGTLMYVLPGIIKKQSTPPKPIV